MAGTLELAGLWAYGHVDRRWHVAKYGSSFAVCNSIVIPWPRHDEIGDPRLVCSKCMDFVILKQRKGVENADD